MTEEKREILKKLEVGTTYSGVDVICRQYKEIERLNNRIEKAKHFIDQVLGYHLSSGYERLDKDVNELYGILMGVDKE